MSQFHYGSITTRLPKGPWNSVEKSQFHYGSITTWNSVENIVPVRGVSIPLWFDYNQFYPIRDQSLETESQFHYGSITT